MSSIEKYSDEYVEIRAQFLIREELTKKVKVTCRCGSVQILHIPKFVDEGKMIPVIPCDECHQEYVIYNKQFVRLENFKTINGELLPKEVLNHESWNKKPRAKEN